MHVHVFQREHWWTLVSSWPDELEKVGQPEKNVLKKRYKTIDKLSTLCTPVMLILTFLLYLNYVFLLYITPRYICI